MGDFIRAFFKGYITAFGYREPNYQEDITLESGFENIGDAMWNNIETEIENEKEQNV